MLNDGGFRSSNTSFCAIVPPSKSTEVVLVVQLRATSQLMIVVGGRGVLGVEAVKATIAGATER
jgi:hypothetical protein